MVKKIIAKKILTDEELSALKGHKLPSNYFKIVLKEDADVYSEDGNLLLRFRKNVLNKKLMDVAFENMIDHAKKLVLKEELTLIKMDRRHIWKN